MGLFSRLFGKGKVYSTKVVVNIVKKRGDAIVVDKEKAEIIEEDEKSKTRVLYIPSYDQKLPVDMHRFRVDDKGVLETTVVESRDGTLKFMDIKESRVEQEDDASWRRSLEATSIWAERMFERGKTFFEEWGGLIMTVAILFVGAIGMLIIYAKMGELSKNLASQLAEVSKQNAEITKELARLMNTMTQQMGEISKNIATASQNLKDVAVSIHGG